MYKKVKKYTTERIKEYDAFGYTLSVLFDKEKDNDAYYPTFSGGMVTLIIYLLMSAFIYIQFLKIYDGALETASNIRQYNPDELKQNQENQ